MKTNAIIGFFDVKEYKKGVELKDRKFKAEGDQITFSTSYKPEQLPKEFTKYAKPFTTKDGEERLEVKFKLSGKVRWYDGNARPMAKPLNEDLFRKRFQAVIDYTQLDGNPEEKEACGYWANAIMVEQVQDNPFEGAPLRAAQPDVQPAQEEHDNPPF